jgi:septation ring formation regulator EzrA
MNSRKLKSISKSGKLWLENKQYNQLIKAQVALENLINDYCDIRDNHKPGVFSYNLAQENIHSIHKKIDEIQEKKDRIVSLYSQLAVEETLADEILKEVGNG